MKGEGGEAGAVNMVDAFCWYDSADAARFGATLGDGEDNAAAGNRTPTHSVSVVAVAVVEVEVEVEVEVKDSFDVTIIGERVVASGRLRPACRGWRGDLRSTLSCQRRRRTLPRRVSRSAVDVGLARAPGRVNKTGEGDSCCGESERSGRAEVDAATILLSLLAEVAGPCGECGPRGPRREFVADAVAAAAAAAATAAALPSSMRRRRALLRVAACANDTERRREGIDAGSVERRSLCASTSRLSEANMESSIDIERPASAALDRTDRRTATSLLIGFR